jgi:hypothetical protein
VISLLGKVKLLALNERGVLLTGIEIYPTHGGKGAGPMFLQTWWCDLTPKARPTIADPAEARRRDRERQAREVGSSLLRRPARRRRHEP